MALVPELQDHGCSLRGSVICKYVKGDVVRCADCDYKKLSENGRRQVVVEFYKAEGVLDGYPIVDPDAQDCALCTGKQKNKAVSHAYSKITNKKMDVKRDLAGSGGSINGGEIDVEAPACQSCLNNLKKFKHYNSAVIALIAVVVCGAVVAVNMSMPAVTGVVPMAAFIICVTLGFGAYLGCMRLLGSAMAKKTCISVFDLPQLKGFKQNGWYVRRGSKFMPSLYDKPPFAFIDPLRPEESMPQKGRRPREERI